MQRKIIQIGNSTQLISLPRKWAKGLGIKKGDEVTITEQGNKLVISTIKGGEIEKATLKLSTKEKFLTRPIHALYKMGYDEITVEFQDPDIIALLQNQTENLLGLEMVDHTAKTCTLRNVASAMESEFDSLFRRIFLMLNVMADDALKAVKSGNYDSLSEIEKREKRNDRLAMFCQRLLIKKGYKDFRRTCMMYEILALLENVADDYRALCCHILDKKPKYDKEFIRIFASTNELLALCNKMFYQFSFDQIVQFKKQHAETFEEAKTLLEKNKGDALSLHYILTILWKNHTLTESLPYI